MGQYLEQAARKTAPPAAIALTAGNGAALGAGIDLSAYVGKWLTIKAPGKTHFRFGPTSTVSVATTDWWLATDEERDFFITEELKYVNAWGVGAAHACIAVVSG